MEEGLQRCYKELLWGESSWRGRCEKSLRACVLQIQLRRGEMMSPRDAVTNSHGDEQARQLMGGCSGLGEQEESSA